MKPVFLDASYLLAIEIANDQNHAAAIEHWGRNEATGLPEFVTTTFVFNEVVTYLNSRNLHSKAVEVGEDLQESPQVRLVHVGEDLFQSAWRYLVQHRDKRYSLADCASFVLMREFELAKAYSFDRHFRQAGFEMEP